MEEYVSEREQIEQIRSWTSTNGPWLVAGVALFAAAFAGYTQWQHWQASKSLQASEGYSQVLDALTREDRQGAAKLADHLRADYGRTPYPDQADLALARAYVEANQLADADARLTVVVEHARDESLKILARYRLARVQRAEGHADAALKTLAAGPPGGFAAPFAEVRGDIAADRGDRQTALAEYRTAKTAGGEELINHDVLDLKIAALAGEPTSEGAVQAAPAVKP